MPIGNIYQYPQYRGLDKESAGGKLATQLKDLMISLVTLFRMTVFVVV